METIYESQILINESILKFITNLKKTAAERRSVDYFKRRAEILENYWLEYERNHNNICGFGIKDHPYFKQSDYESTRQLYLKAKDIIEQQQQELRLSRTPAAEVHEQHTNEPDPLEISSKTEQPTDPRPGPSREFTSRGSTSKIDDLLRKQNVNFKALMRTAYNIKLDSICERWEFEDVLRELQARWAAIDSLHWDIYMELGGEDVEYETSFSKHEQTFINLKKAINKKLWSVAHIEKSLPQMDIPLFFGSYQQWTSFKDLFNESIHNNPSLSPAQKMQFLKGKLRGEAERLIQHLPISTSNYSVCWEILNNRYNNKKLIFNSHLNTLMGLPTLSQQSVAQLKRMHDVTLECLHAIRNLGVDVASWDPMLVQILSQKLDKDTYEDYVDSLKNPRDLPVLKEFLAYLESKFTNLESSRRKQDSMFKITAHNNQSKHHNFNRKPTYNSPSNNQNYSIPKSYHVSEAKCVICKEAHGVPNCSKFINMSNEIRLQTVNRLKLCMNCLFVHHSKQCISTKRCRKCNGRHHTLIHDCFVKNYPSNSYATSDSKRNETPQNKLETVANNLHVSQLGPSEVLLATALIKVKSIDGSYQTLRALIDQGSQISLISENAAQRLGVKRSCWRGVVYGLGEKESNCKGMLSISCRSIYNNFTFSTDALIMNNLIKNLPTSSFEQPAWSFIQNVNLADPEFYVSRPVDILLGSDIYALIKMGGIRRGDDPSQPLAEQTQLGWILFGKMQSFQCNVVMTSIQDMKKFWEIEEVGVESDLSSDDNACLDFYRSTTTRRSDGRYVVKLPIKPDMLEKLGESKNTAIAQFFNLEKKFSKQSDFANDYKSFIREYISLKHMIPVSLNLSRSTSDDRLQCYLPHHGVQKSDSLTTKLRVVYNASAKTSTGYSLNDVMYTGPNMQKDLQCLILKWRVYPLAFTSDIEKMYRQILVSDDDQKYQQIVWRESTDEMLQAYRLATVTYGTKAAPFLAMMTLKQLATDESSKYPEAARVLQESFYMDDLLHGSFDIGSGQKLIAELSNLLKAGGFTLRKWISNEPELLNCIENVEQDSRLIFNFKSDSSTKTLGLRWVPREDKFKFNYSLNESKKVTKRMVLAEISKIFDPLGWIAPLTTKLKLIFQKIWSESLQWDDELPDEIKREWFKIQSDIYHLHRCEIPRWIGFQPQCVLELHGFCDASLKAYAGVIYARVVKESEATVVLLASKSKLVACNKTISLPKLEMCAAHLLSRLMEKVLNCLKEYNLSVYGWSDSMVVLGWLQGDPGRWKTFVANRVKSVTEVIKSDRWRYVKSVDNPADAASRGLLASQLADTALWWQGPEWLKTFNDDQKQINYTTDEEVKVKHVNVVQNSGEDSIINNLLNSKSSLTKIIRILAWILRALNNTFNKHERDLRSYLTLQEIKRAKLLIIKYVQRTEFREDFDSLIKHNKLHNKSKLLNLNVFLDKNQIMRVGGRLKNAVICDDMKYPILIPYSSPFTNLLIEQMHHITYHGGPRLTLSNLRQRYWIVSGTRAVKKEIRKCVTCRKHSPSNQYQLMGNLPSERINRAAPFYHTGVDYTGFVEVKASKGRGIKTTKGYIALFICMVTKAVHLELVSDLSSSAFLAALRRMAARRGAPRHLYSDNGTNFVGANKTLKAEYHDLRSTLDESFFNAITDMQIEWHFNSPSWPSAGGLWERAIKSLKHHLKRVVGEQKLTFEEYSTILAQIEGCLNSRPLCPLTENTDDLDCLTPAHFLIGRTGTSIIETEHDARTRWHLVSKLTSDLWKRFKTEYLSQLSVRSKWLKEQSNMKIGDLVTIHDDNLPPGKWLLGRVIDMHPGTDGLVRVVTLKTKNGVIKRPIIKLSILPISSEKKEEEVEVKREKERRTATKQGKRSFIAIALSLVLFLTLASGSEALLNVTKLNNSQALYYDKIGNMRLARDEWKLVVYYKMKPYWEGMTAIEKYIKYSDSICNSASVKMHCGVALAQVRHSLSELEFINRILLGQRNSSNITRRRRRGLINGVGYLAHALFGVLDDNFAEQYKRDIAEIGRNENHLRALWRNQTSIIEGQNNILKRMEEMISDQHRVVNQHLSELGRGFNNLKNEVEHIEAINEFTISIIIVGNLITSLRSIQDQVVEMITDVHYERFSLHLLSPQQLQNELNIISGQMAKDLALPVDDIQHEMSDLYKLLKVKTRMTNEYFIFEIRIPLIYRDVFELHQLIAVPHQAKSSMYSIIPASKYVAINLHNDIYVPMEDRDMQKCIYLDSVYAYHCDIHSTVFHLKADSQLCVQDPASNLCTIIEVPCSNKWIKLQQTNTFLFSCCNKCAIRLMCKEHITMEQLTESGIAHLAESCILKEKDFTTYTESKISTSMTINSDLYNPQISPINTLLNITLKLPYDNETTDSALHQDIQRAAEQIKQLQKSEPVDEEESMWYHHVHHYVVSYGLLLLVLLAIAGFVLRRRYCRRGRQPRAEAAPAPPPASNSEVSAVSARKLNEDQCSVRVEEQRQDRATSPILLRVFKASDVQ